MTRPRAKRSLGQNFLLDPNLQRKIVASLGAGAEDVVVEVGPGRGALTRHLAGRVGHLVLIELDDDLAAELQREWGGRDDVAVVHDDVLRVSLADHVPDPERALVLGNIPYNITTPILFHLLERPRPARLVLTMQKEVGERLVAEPGGRSYGALSVGVQSVARVRRLFDVPRRAFRPVPRVESTVMEVTPLAPPPLSVIDERRLRTLTRCAFQWRRKQLRKILRDHPELSWPADEVEDLAGSLGLDLTARPEVLDPEMLLALARVVVREPG